MHCWCAFVCVSVYAYIADVFTFELFAGWLYFPPEVHFWFGVKQIIICFLSLSPSCFCLTEQDLTLKQKSLKMSATSASLMSYFCVGKGFFLLASTLFIHFINDLLNYCSCNPLQTRWVEGGSCNDACLGQMWHPFTCLSSIYFVLNTYIRPVQSMEWSISLYVWCSCIITLFFF